MRGSPVGELSLVRPVRSVGVDAETGVPVVTVDQVSGGVACRQLRELMERFLRGEDRSVRFTNQIEAFMSEKFRRTDIYEELMEDLATYSPGGGEFLIDEDRRTQVRVCDSSMVVARSDFRRRLALAAVRFEAGLT